jgi:hypothetical protein
VAYDNDVRHRGPSSSASLDTPTVRPNRDATNDHLSGGGLDDEDPIMQLLVQHVGGGDSSSRQSLQAAGPAGELMDRLQSELERRLSKSQNNAHSVGLVDDVKGFNTKTKDVDEEIDLEDAKLDQARRDAAAAAAVNH